LHLVLRLPAAVDDEALAADALVADLALRPLSRYYSLPRLAQRGLLLGYACVRQEEIKPAFAKLARVLRRHGL
jgi:GntR family transcriptional regulator / MocR family aminotransferase